MDLKGTPSQTCVLLSVVIPHLYDNTQICKVTFHVENRGKHVPIRVSIHPSRRAEPYNFHLLPARA